MSDRTRAMLAVSTALVLATGLGATVGFTTGSALAGTLVGAAAIFIAVVTISRLFGVFGVDSEARRAVYEARIPYSVGGAVCLLIGSTSAFTDALPIFARAIVIPVGLGIYFVGTRLHPLQPS